MRSDRAEAFLPPETPAMASLIAQPDLPEPGASVNWPERPSSAARLDSWPRAYAWPVPELIVRPCTPSRISHEGTKPRRVAGVVTIAPTRGHTYLALVYYLWSPSHFIAPSRLRVSPFFPCFVIGLFDRPEPDASVNWPDRPTSAARLDFQPRVNTRPVPELIVRPYRRLPVFAVTFHRFFTFPSGICD